MSEKDLKTNLLGHFEEQENQWRKNMINTFGDLYPYDFSVTYGHFEDQLLYLDGKSLKSCNEEQEPFKNLHGLVEADKKAEEEFLKHVSKFDDKGTATVANEFLQTKKDECAKVLQSFDEIVKLCEKYFELEESNHQKHIKEQISVQNDMVNFVDRYLKEVEEAGDRNINNLKTNLSNYLEEKSLAWHKEIENTYSSIYKEPLMMEAINECVNEMTSLSIQERFVQEQRETALIWKKAFDDILMLSTELEKYRFNYTVTKSNLERAIIWMKQSYRDNMPDMTKNQRQATNLKDQKMKLFQELSTLEEAIQIQKLQDREDTVEFYRKLRNVKDENQRAKNRAFQKHEQVLHVQKTEAFDLLETLLGGDKHIHEEILFFERDIVDVVSLKSLHDNAMKKEDSDCDIRDKQVIPVLKNDEFSKSYKLLFEEREFVPFLNYVANELGFMLDFQWVDYVKENLNLKQDIKWIELFNVFQVHFTKDMKKLKDYMKKFCKIKNLELVLNLEEVIKGFLNFVCIKNQLQPSQAILPEMRAYHEMWHSIAQQIPQSLLWDSVAELLTYYVGLLQTRSRLLKKRSSIIQESEEILKLLGNYYSYCVPKVTEL